MAARPLITNAPNDLGPGCDTRSEFFRLSRLGKTCVELVAVATTA
jgi:hypothetical protein